MIPSSDPTATPILPGSPRLDAPDTDSPLDGLFLPISPAPSYISPSPTIAVVLPDPKRVNRLVEEIIERAGMSQAEVARRLGITPQSLNQYFTHRRERPSIIWIARLAEVCGARLLVEFPRAK